METRQVISHASGANQIIFFDDRRLVLGLGQVMLPLTQRSLGRLSELMLTVARDFERHARDGRVYIHGDTFVLRLTQVEFFDLLSVVSQALGWLHSRQQGLPS
ncbi:MAG: hypothetical protein Q8O14_13675 [bacterium]|nr:hypothetical protein [bacterium]